MMRESFRDFVLHLRLGFQLFVAPASYLLGGLFSDFDRPSAFALHYLNVHVLLLGGATAYNSFYDKDEGPVEGLRHPPPIRNWMLFASCALQVTGFFAALSTSPTLAVIYFITMLGFSFGYSNPRVRWKARPLFSLVVIGIFGGLSPFALGFFAGGGGPFTPELLSAALGSSLLVVATFPLTQVHQIEEDRRRGDETFSVRYGVQGVRTLFAVLYPLGAALMSLSFLPRQPLVALSLAIAGIIFGTAIWHRVRLLTGSITDFEWLVRTKTLSGTALNLFLLSLLLMR